MEVINLNLIPSGALPVVHASQYDEGRTFRANLMDGSTVYTLDGTEVLECDVKKPDGNIVTVAVTNTSDSYVEIDTTLQMCACAGESLAELHITKGAQEIGTLNFILAVERSPLEGGIQSDSGIHNLQTQIGEAVADQYAAEDVVFDAAPVAGHGTGFAVTSEGVKTYVEGEIAALTIPEELDDLADVTITTPSDDDILVYQNGEWVNMANPASTANFGADYDENTTYNTGDKCVYNNLLYECNDDGVTGAWDVTKWDSLTVASMTDNNLPHYTGTPTEGSTAEAINKVDGKATSEVLTLQAEHGVTIAYSSVSKNDKLVTITAEVRFSGNGNAWTNLATIAYPPRVVQLSAPAVNSANGSLMGILQVQSSGNIRIYPTTTQSNGACAFSISYLTA